MRIRSQLIFSLGLSSAVCIAALAGLITYLHTEDALRRGQDRAQSAAQAAADLLALTQEFAYTGEARAAQQWHLRAAAIDEAIGPEGAHVGEQANVLRKLDTDLADISALFIELEHSGKFGTSVGL